MSKIITISEAATYVKDGMTVMVGGFMGTGGPNRIMDVLASSGLKNLTIICNDTAFPDKGVGKLVANRQVKHVIASHIGTNPITIELMNNGTLAVSFYPQGTLAECIRASGAGLGGVLTPTGLGTVVALGKQVISIDGKEYLLEKPLKADIALLHANIADESGNLIYKGTTQNFNPIMATAADLVIAEVDEIVPTGTLDPERVHTSAIFIDYLAK
ncbi:MAG: CoA transferase subunit A [Prevotellaceae bacterium]|jgi:acetate CoA/acetoacetate CoA-transferase alpha subunit|nr:CoA transferase subunit A [Prevotellaceae bacterium]